MAEKHSNKLFEIRTIIGLVLGIIGIFLLIVGFVSPEPNKFLLPDAAAINSNIWAGIGLVVVAAIMFIWEKVDPNGGSAPKSELTPREQGFDQNENVEPLTFDQ